MFSVALRPSPAEPDQVVFRTYEYCGPNWILPFGPLYRRYQNPTVPSERYRGSPLQVPVVVPVKPALDGGTCSVHFAAALGLPYPMGPGYTVRSAYSVP